MSFYGYDQDKAIANCSSQSRGEYQQKLASLRSWQKLGPEHVVGLLEDAAMPARPQARALAGLLEQMAWRVMATVRSGDKGDETPCVMLEVAGRKYQLRCKETPELHVTEITV